MTARETCDIVRHIKPLGEVDFSGEIFFSPRSVITAWLFCAEHGHVSLHTDEQYTFAKK